MLDAMWVQRKTKGYIPFNGISFNSKLKEVCSEHSQEFLFFLLLQINGITTNSLSEETVEIV